MNAKEIDAAILCAASPDWEKAVHVVGKVAYSLKVRYSTVGTRMTALVDKGALLWAGGDISDGGSWLKALVRKPD